MNKLSLCTCVTFISMSVLLFLKIYSYVTCIFDFPSFAAPPCILYTYIFFYDNQRYTLMTTKDRTIALANCVAKTNSRLIGQTQTKFQIYGIHFE